MGFHMSAQLPRLIEPEPDFHSPGKAKIGRRRPPSTVSCYVTIKRVVKEFILFVQPTKKTGSKPTPFIYSGQVDFLSWEGEAPISIRWQLREVVPPALHNVLSVPS